MVSAKILALGAFIAVAQAHFTLDYPWTRGFDETLEPQSPCGGFPVNKTRTPFPLSGGFIEYSSYHTTADSIAAVSFSSDPTTLTNFNTTSSGATYGLLVPTWSTTVQGSFCVHVNISSLGVSDAKDGANATIVMIYNGSDGILHQCSDLVLMANYTIPSSIACTSAGSITGGSMTGAGPTASSPSSQSSTSKGTASNPASSPTQTSHSAASVSTSINGVLAAIGLMVTVLFL